VHGPGNCRRGSNGTPREEDESLREKVLMSGSLASSFYCTSWKGSKGSNSLTVEEGEPLHEPLRMHLSPADDRPGLCWLLQGRPVVALTEATAAIMNPTGAITTYRKNNKPALGSVGDSLNDLEAPFGG
jgi:hypothetical protein